MSTLDLKALLKGGENLCVVYAIYILLSVDKLRDVEEPNIDICIILVYTCKFILYFKKASLCRKLLR